MAIIELTNISSFKAFISKTFIKIANKIFDKGPATAILASSNSVKCVKTLPNL